MRGVSLRLALGRPVRVSRTGVPAVWAVPGAQEPASSAWLALSRLLKTFHLLAEKAAPGDRVICETKRKPSLRSERERRERQAVRLVLILSRLTSFPACLAAGSACVLLRLCGFVEQITLSRGIPRSKGFFSTLPTDAAARTNMTSCEILAA